MADLEAQMREELEQIVAALGKLTGLKSRWSGRVELVLKADFKGKKRFTCDIELDADLARQEARWPTLIHEALHSLSAGYIAADFRTYRGWEEGGVEQLQRLFRPDVLRRLRVTTHESAFAEPFEHPFEGYIEALETIRQAASVPEGSDVKAFYLGLLATPIRDRFTSVLRHAFSLSGRDQIAYVATLSAANSVLTGRLP